MSTTAQPNTTSTSTFAAVEINALPLLARRRRRQLVCRRARRRALTPTVRLIGEAVVARCKCARCAVRPEAEDGDCTLPLPQPARPHSRRTARKMRRRAAASASRSSTRRSCRKSPSTRPHGPSRRSRLPCTTSTSAVRVPEIAENRRIRRNRRTSGVAPALARACSLSRALLSLARPALAHTLLSRAPARACSRARGVPCAVRARSARPAQMSRAHCRRQP